jgi:formylmethanofuran--tetrahydromethanopterin N-formyltransferase
MTGFATSVIGCKCEAGIERELCATETLDGRPAVSVLLFAMDSESLGKRLIERIGQCVMTCPTTACFNGLEAEKSVLVGGKLRYFGDGYQAAKLLAGRRFWRIPVMDGEFLVDERFGIQKAVGGGNLLILGEDAGITLSATEAAVAAMRKVPGVILPFPDGVVRSGSKVGSRYKTLIASTNDAYCPSLRAVAPQTQVPPQAGCVLEIVIDGLDLMSVEHAMRSGMHAAAQAGAMQISAGNYGGRLGKYSIALSRLLERS